MKKKCTWHDHLTPRKSEKKIDYCLCVWPGLDSVFVSGIVSSVLLTVTFRNMLR